MSEDRISKDTTKVFTYQWSPSLVQLCHAGRHQWSWSLTRRRCRRWTDCQWRSARRTAQKSGARPPRWGQIPRGRDGRQLGWRELGFPFRLDLKWDKENGHIKRSLLFCCPCVKETTCRWSHFAQWFQFPNRNGSDKFGPFPLTSNQLPLQPQTCNIFCCC